MNIGIGAQSPDIAQGVDTAHETRVEGAGDPLDAQGAGDQGLMFGYAIKDTPELMPLPIALAHRLARRLTEVRKSGVLDYLRPDGKTQVTVQYDGNTPVRLDTVVLSTQHADGIDLESDADPGHPREGRQHRPRPTWTTTPWTPPTTGCWSTRPASSCSAARWATPA